MTLPALCWLLYISVEILEDGGGYLARSVLLVLWKFQTAGKIGYLRSHTFLLLFSSSGRLSSPLESSY